LLAAHLFHARVLWTEENLPLAAAMQMKHGSVLYRDIWFDKPPLLPAIYLLWGARIGVVLRVAGAVYAFLCCLLAYGLAATWWSRREGYWAAALIGFFLTFDTHSAVLPLAADLLLLAPHLAAVLLTARKQFFWSGVAAGIGFLINTKGAFVLAACAVFAWPGMVPLLAGFVLPNIAALGYLAGTGALAPYIDQVWRWGAEYAASPVAAHPLREGIVRTANWLGFHAVLVIGIIAWWIADRERGCNPRVQKPSNWTRGLHPRHPGGTLESLGPPIADRAPAWPLLMVWVALCGVGVVLGWRFFPRYYFLLLPTLAIPAARGLAAMPRRVVPVIVIATMIVPLARFGPRYAMLAGWNDLAMDRDSRAASKLALQYAPQGGSLYVWGYRPEMYAYTQLRPATKYLDCQALTGVPADRHLGSTEIVLTKGTHEAREELAHSMPDVVIDGLSRYNSALSMTRYPELQPWLDGYREVAHTQGSVIYARRARIEP
jgi:hypothetical protein